MLRILHCSDLHFCSDEVAPTLDAFLGSLGKVLPLDLDISRASPEVTKALSNLIQELDPDALIVSGDITALGDRSSFELAAQWIRPLLVRKGGERRPCLAVPGNHDILLAQLADLERRTASRIPGPLRAALRFWLRHPLSSIRALSESALGKNGDNPLANFARFAESTSVISNQMLTLPLDSSSVVLHPFCSVSLDPIWLNLGERRVEDIERFSVQLRDPQSRGPGKLRIVVLHHNPVSSAKRVDPALVNAYNSMPAGAQFMRTLQNSGVDLILHGHQHEQARLQFDFDLNSSGHAFALGVGCSSAREAGSCNLLTVQDINHVNVETYQYDGAFGEFRPLTEQALCLERNRPLDFTTLTTRLELKRFISGDHEEVASELWDELQVPGADLIYISGRRLKTVTEAKMRSLRTLLERSPNTYLRILLGNPFLFKHLSEVLASASKELLWGEASGPPDTLNPTGAPNFWGRREELEELARDSKGALTDLRAFVASLNRRDKERINIRVSHTILPFAATVRSPEKPWGQMVLRLLPVGAIGDLRMPVLKLNRRSNFAMFDYYLQHMRYLIGRGRTILGDWNRGDDDLRIADLEPPNPSR